MTIRFIRSIVNAKEVIKDGRNDVKYTLKTARELNGLKQKDAAKLLGISVDTLRKL